MVPYLLGIAWARGSFRGWRGPALMLAGGVAGTVALVAWAGYPASMVGVNGAAISNLNPPTLAVVTFGIAQVGLALLLREPLARLMRRPVAWAAVATVNLSAMTLYLWHQTAFLAVTMAGLLIGRLPGLHTAPSSALWVAERLAWLPVFAVALAALWLVFHRAEHGRRQPADTPASRPPGPDRAIAGAEITAAARSQQPGIEQVGDQGEGLGDLAAVRGGDRVLDDADGDAGDVSAGGAVAAHPAGGGRVGDPGQPGPVGQHLQHRQVHIGLGPP